MAALLLALSLLTPLIGPDLDHHFVERFPGHGHAYLGPVPAEHEHVFGRPHSEGRPAGGQGGAAIQTVAVFQLDAGAQPGSAASGLTGALERGQVQGGAAWGPLFEIVSRTSGLSNAIVPPPEQPPRV